MRATIPMNRSRVTLGILTATLAVGCGALRGDREESREAREIAAALELENGGLEETDEAPMFADEPSFADVVDQETLVVDQLEADATVVALTRQADTARIEVALLWGQIPGNPANDSGQDWTGKISISRGALLVRRTIRFEEGADRLAPRRDLREVEFTSVTRPHHDGLRLTVLDPEPLADDPLVFTYENASGIVYQGPISALIEAPESVTVDDAGSRFVGLAVARPVDVCELGFLGGKWSGVAPGRGRVTGVVTDAAGEPMGHVKGIWGKRRSGEQAFFGKYIDADGRFRGIFAGRYGDGEYAGRWLHAAREAGALGGRYFDTPGRGGKLVGAWAETSCNLAVGPAAAPSPAPSR